MLCSNCSSELKPVVALDIDGTLGDYHGHFEAFAVAYLGRDMVVNPQYDGTEPHGEWFCREYCVDRQTFRDIKLAYRQGAMKRSMPIFAGAKALAAKCFEAGAEVWVTTTRPYLRLDNIDPDTRAWLERHDIYYDGLLYHEDKYHWLAEHIDAERVVAILDDLPEMYDAAGEAFGFRVPILRKNVYNRGATRAVETYALVGGVTSASSIIKQRLENWRPE